MNKEQSTHALSLDCSDVWWKRSLTAEGIIPLSELESKFVPIV